jgi:acetyltransferase-like isoleucine patch superfamily enzyme
MSDLPQVQPRSEDVLDQLRSIQIQLHTALQRWRFAHWGSRSRLEYPSKLTSPHLVTVGNHVHICANAWLNAKDDRGDGQPTLRIGDGTYIGRMVQINAWRQVDIADNVLIGDRVLIIDADHYFNRSDLPILAQGDGFKGPVRLLEGCWIAAGAVILPGVTIGRNAVVASNAVVTRDVPERTVAGGVPAKIFRQLNQED